jgi:hypothetical protein
MIEARRRFGLDMKPLDLFPSGKLPERIIFRATTRFRLTCRA